MVAVALEKVTLLKATMMGLSLKVNYRMVSETARVYITTRMVMCMLVIGKKISLKGWVDEGDRGTYIYANGERYEGELVGGHKEGQGCYFYNNGNLYFGEWKKDKKHGKGRYEHCQTGDVYEGEWYMGEKKGEGVFQYSHGPVYSGSWSKNEKNGKGRLDIELGSYYDGHWQNVEAVDSGQG